jgi:sulfatase maturation enzyme AslB (radical SAM superfamily)
VSFIGGEFFLTKRNLEILDMIIQRKLQARIITNATVITNQLLARLQKIQDLDLMISADGLGETYELIRHPAAWHVTAQNIDILKRELPQARVHLYTVVQPLNWLNMGAFLQWANRHLLPVTLTNLQDPAWLSWSILDQQERQRFADAEIQTPLTRSQTAEIANFRNLIRNTSYQETLRQQFENNMSALLAHRNIPYSMVHQASGITLRKH